MDVIQTLDPIHIDLEKPKDDRYISSLIQCHTTNRIAAFPVTFIVDPATVFGQIPDQFSDFFLCHIIFEFELWSAKAHDDMDKHRSL